MPQEKKTILGYFFSNREMLCFYVKFKTDRKTNSWTPLKQYAPDLSMWGHKKSENYPFSARNIQSFQQVYFRCCESYSTLQQTYSNRDTRKEVVPLVGHLLIPCSSRSILSCCYSFNPLPHSSAF